MGKAGPKRRGIARPLPGGDGELAPILAKAAVATGVDGLFMEVHEDPDSAPSDGPNMLVLDDLAPLLQQLRAIERAAPAT